MNNEISRMRKNRDESEAFSQKPERLDEKYMLDMVYQLNSNFSDIHSMNISGKIDTDEVAKKVTENIYIVLNMFDKMGVYPDYFYDEIFKTNVEYKNMSDKSVCSLRENFQLYKNYHISARVSKAMKNGLEKGYYHIQAYPKKDINDSFLEMVTFFEAFNIPYNINTPEQCKNTFNEINYNHVGIVTDLINSDYIFEDVEYLSRLLFEYMSFLVSLGIHPKEYLDNLIDENQDVKKK